MKKVMVTGAAGFVGRHVIEELIKAGYSVTASDVSAEAARGFGWFPHVTFFEYDMNTDAPQDLYGFFGRPDALIHLAWQGLPNYNELFHVERNLHNGYCFLKNLIVNGLPSLTVAGTCFEFGKQEGCLAESTVTLPNTAYSLAKDTLRKMLDCLLRKHPNCCFKWARLFYVYGPGQAKGSLLALLQQALDNKESEFNMSGGEQLRDYLPVNVMAKHIVKIAVQDQVRGIINCCSGRPISIRRLVENYLEEKGRTIKLNLGHYPYPEHEPMAFWGDNSKLKKIIDLESGNGK